MTLEDAQALKHRIEVEARTHVAAWDEVPGFQYHRLRIAQRFEALRHTMLAREALARAYREVATASALIS